MSHLTELCATTPKQAPVCLVCSAKRDGEQSWQSAVTSDDCWDFWSLDWHNETALCLIKSPFSVLHFSISLFIALPFNLPLLCFSQFICHVLRCLSSAVDSLSPYVVRLLYFIFITARASLEHGCEKRQH